MPSHPAFCCVALSYANPVLQLLLTPGDIPSLNKIRPSLWPTSVISRLQGVAKENVPKVEALVLDTLKKIAEEGFDQEAIDASINSIEFNLREFNTGSFPRCGPVRLLDDTKV